MAALDPVTAFANLATELTKLVIVIAESQPTEVRQELWRMYLKDLQWWRRLLKIDEPA